MEYYHKAHSVQRSLVLEKAISRTADIYLKRHSISSKKFFVYSKHHTFIQLTISF